MNAKSDDESDDENGDDKSSKKSETDAADVKLNSDLEENKK